MDRTSKITIAEVVAHSGIDERIVQFAVFNGYRLAQSDLTLDEQVTRLQIMYPLKTKEDLLVWLGDDLKDDIA